MKYKKFYFLLIIMTICLHSCSKKEEFIYSNAQSGLRIRNLPDLNSEKIAIFPYKEKALILEKNSELVEIDGLTNYWYKIKYLNYTGWVFGAYTSSIHPNEIKPGADSYTGLVYNNIIPDFKNISNKSISENIEFNIYQDKKGNYFGFLEEINKINDKNAEKKVLYAIKIDLAKNDEFLESMNQCYTPDEKEITFAIYNLDIDTTGDTIGNHYELVIKKFKVKKSWILSEDKKYLQPLTFTKGIKCVFPDPANILEPVSD